MNGTKANQMKKIVVSNQKGGVGKTFVSTQLAFFAQEKGLRVLFVDNDSQGNAAATLGSVANKVLKTDDLYTQKIDFGVIEEKQFILFEGGNELKSKTNDSFKTFKENIEAASEFFDICIFDTPPAEGTLQDFPMAICDGIVSPFELHEYSYMGFKRIIERIKQIQQHNKGMLFLGFIPNKVDVRMKHHREQLEEITNAFSSFMFGGGDYIPSRAVYQAYCARLPAWKVKGHAKEGKVLQQLSKNIFDKVGV
jgi:chromosome partitioning protein